MIARFHPFLLSLWLTVFPLLHAEHHEPEFHIKECNSGVDYPTKGDEALDIKYEELTYRVRIHHPKVMDGPHFSSPFFWVEGKDGLRSLNDIIALRSHIGGLNWHAAAGYFFAQKNGKLRGFFLEDGFDNADNGSSGLIFLDEGEKYSAWHWRYQRDPNKKKGNYVITNANQAELEMPKELISALTPVLNRAEKDADAWPGP